jgi:hypothetical protein
MPYCLQPFELLDVYIWFDNNEKADSRSPFKTAPVISFSFLPWAPIR